MSTPTDVETVRALAALARLELSAEELERFAPELERILAAFETLARPHPVARHAPSSPPALPMPAVARTREDVPVPSLGRDELLASASASEEGFFVVPKTVGDAGPPGR
jgi:aspartyl-tRNA(Asn)/glutamyl-tRNA(Gln) amidotransferase subunit C